MKRISKIPWVALIVCGKMFSRGPTVTTASCPDYVLNATKSGHDADRTHADTVVAAASKFEDSQTSLFFDHY